MIVGKREAWTGRLFLVLLMAFTIVPFVSLFVTALHPSGSYPSGLEWPSEPRWGNFADAFRAAHMGDLLWSSTLIVLGVVPVSLVLATMAGFALGHLRMAGRHLVFLMFVLGLTLPFEGIITPLYYVVRDMGLLNTRWAIILPLIGLFMPFAVYWMRAHFINLPDDLSEAAQLDGANVWQLFWRVHVPLAAPAISSLAILLFLWTWNQFLLAIVLVDDPARRTMAGALGAFQGQWGTDIPLLCAGSLLILAPTLIVFLIFQRRFVSALLQGSVKG
ncbi:carbohydrate ABC transporter permease [Streptomyces millisiae]|uniref:Carbohydrate ABC transporter permease n=1 Tax=Streptomyces millisiae TaxID=3075542 RepID=A0ABU2LP06_9ACTN|nr:carbohydrate ABC transporter permease [Streptomyces sp. DSM 44918]MDT0319008.1 carbohydrate ABC transporter permease [Streptomyces sp. DSM 44918]